MNPHRSIQFAYLLGFLFALSILGTLQAATTNAPVAGISTNDFKSAFNSKGRDPFFPNSSRLQAVDSSENGDVPQPTIVLAVKGFSGTGNHRMAIINDHTFVVGEESEVLTGDGRIRIRCVEIRDDVVVVTIGNGPQKIELRMPTRY